MRHPQDFPGLTDKQDVDHPEFEIIAEEGGGRRNRRLPMCAVEPRAVVGRRFLTFEGCGGDLVAIPLERVERIESVPVGSIGWVAGHVLRRPSGKIVRLEDRCGVLAGLQAVSDEESAGWTVTVLVCKWRADGEVRRLGVVVGRVLPVAEADGIESGKDGMRLALAGGGSARVHEKFAEGVGRRRTRMALAAAA